jgi:hypothetical protein
MIMLSKLIKPSMQCLKLVKILTRLKKNSISIKKRGMAKNWLVKNPTLPIANAMAQVKPLGTRAWNYNDC